MVAGYWWKKLDLSSTASLDSLETTTLDWQKLAVKMLHSLTGIKVYFEVKHTLKNIQQSIRQSIQQSIQ